MFHCVLLFKTIVTDFIFQGLPHFISKPSPTTTVKETKNILIPCKANGFPLPVITWYKNWTSDRKGEEVLWRKKSKIKENSIPGPRCLHLFSGKSHGQSRIIRQCQRKRSVQEIYNLLLFL